MIRPHAPVAVLWLATLTIALALPNAAHAVALRSLDDHGAPTDAFSGACEVTTANPICLFPCRPGATIVLQASGTTFTARAGCDDGGSACGRTGLAPGSCEERFTSHYSGQGSCLILGPGARATCTY